MRLTDPKKGIKSFLVLSNKIYKLHTQTKTIILVGQVDPQGALVFSFNYGSNLLRYKLIGVCCDFC